MLHIPYLREHKNEIIKKLKIKNFEANEIIEKLLNKDDSRKATQKTAKNACKTLRNNPKRSILKVQHDHNTNKPPPITNPPQFFL